MDQNEVQADSAPEGMESADSQGKKRRRRRRGRRREDGDSQTAGQDGSQIDDDGAGDDDSASDVESKNDNRPPSVAASQEEASSDGQPAGEGEQRKKKRRRKKKKSGNQAETDTDDSDSESADDAAAEPKQQKPEAPERPRTERPERSERSDRRDRQNGKSDRNERGNGRSNDRGNDSQDAKPEEKEKKTPPSRGTVLKRRMSKMEEESLEQDVPKVQIFMPPHSVSSVDSYISHLRGWQRDVVNSLRNLITKAGLDLEEAILWSQPVYSNGGPVCFIKVFTDHVNLGFWRGTELTDPDHLLVGDSYKMRHVRINNPQDVKKDQFEMFIRQAVRLNKERGDPTV